jgi:hypothetical protein
VILLLDPICKPIPLTNRGTQIHSLRYHKVHHLDHVREQSKPLLTAILGVTARFWSADIASRCFGHLDTILSRAVFAGESDIHLVQALLLAVYWRTPGDKSSWTKTGIAVRMAQALGLHHCFSREFTRKFSYSRELLVSLWRIIPLNSLPYGALSTHTIITESSTDLVVYVIWRALLALQKAHIDFAKDRCRMCVIKPFVIYAGAELIRPLTSSSVCRFRPIVSMTDEL